MIQRRTIFAAALAALSAFHFVHASPHIEQAARAAYQEKDFARSAQLYMQSWEDSKADTSLLYNAARSYALAGDSAHAFEALKQLGDAGYIRVRKMEEDSDFQSLRADPRWAQTVAAMQQRAEFEGRLFDSPALATPYRENISEEEKIAGLSKFWSEVKFNFVYQDTLKQLDWDKVYLEYLPKVRATKSTLEYYRVLMRMCALLKDGHTNVYPARQLWGEQMARPMLRTRLVEGRVIVRDVFDPELKENGIVPGTEVVAVDGEPVRSYAEREIAPYQSASTPQDLDTRTYGYFFLAGAIAQTPRVTFKDAGGKTFELPVRRAQAEDVAKAAPPSPPFEMKMLAGGVAYVALNSFGNDEAAKQFVAAFPEIAKSNALVIDVRNNGGGDSGVGYRVLKTLANGPFQTSMWATRDYRPSYRAWGRPMQDYSEAGGKHEPDAKLHYAKPVVVLTGPATYSAAEDFAVAFDGMKRGLIVGEATGGSTGQPLFFALPGGGNARVCTKRDTYPDGRPFVGVGVQPHLKASPKVDDLRSGKDSVLQAALDAIAHGKMR